MTKKNLFWIVKVVLTTLAAITGFFVLNETVQSPLELLATLGLSAFYFMILPVLIKQTKANVKSILFSATVLITPLVLMRIFFQRPLDTRASFVNIGVGKPIVMVASIVFLVSIFVLSLLSALQNKGLDHNDWRNNL